VAVVKDNEFGIAEGRQSGIPAPHQKWRLKVAF